MKPKYLYHANVRRIEGNKLLPRQAKDLENLPENLHKAVYATNIKNIAIAMAIISCKGVNASSLKFKKKPFGIIYGVRQDKIIFTCVFFQAKHLSRKAAEEINIIL